MALETTSKLAKLLGMLDHDGEVIAAGWQANPEYLTEWEAGFIETLSRRGVTRLSDKQRAVLQRLGRKCARGEYA